MNLRRLINEMLAFDTKDFANVGKRIQNTLRNLVIPGYEIYYDEFSAESYGEGIVISISLEHINPPFKDKVLELQKADPKSWAGAPTSKTTIMRWLTGHRSDPTQAEKEMATKIVQLCGHDAMNSIIQTISQDFKGFVKCETNFTGASIKRKGVSYFELYVFPMMTEEEPDTPKEPTIVPIDDEMIKVPNTPVPPPPKEEKKPKPPKRKTEKDGRVTVDGISRHFLPEAQLESIASHAISIIMGPNKTVVPIKASTIDSQYKEIKALSKNKNTNTHRVIDDYWLDDNADLKFYKAFEVYGGKIRTKSMLQRYLNPNSQVHPNKEGMTTAKSRVGSKEIKDVRKAVASQRASDEILIYANISPRINPYTGVASDHTGEVILIVFLVDRSI